MKQCLQLRQNLARKQREFDAVIHGTPDKHRYHEGVEEEREGGREERGGGRGRGRRGRKGGRENFNW